MTGEPAIRVAPQRRGSIDVLRATAITLMVLVHFVENLSGLYAAGDGPFAGVSGAFWLPTGFAAPTFALLAGVSYRLWLEDARRDGRSDESISKTTVRRGLFLFGLGIVFNVVVWLPEDVFNWDILTLIGCGMFALEAVRRMPDGAIFFTAAVIIAVTPSMQWIAHHSAYWTLGYYDYDLTVADVLLGWLVTGYFPLFPWLAFPLAGYAAAPWLVGMGDREARPSAAARRCIRRSTPIVLVAVAAGFIVCWDTLPAAATGGAARAWTMFPATAPYVLGTLGAVSIALHTAHRFFDGTPQRLPGVVAWAAPLSRRSLSIYLVHHAVHIWPLWAMGLAWHEDAGALWQRAMPATWSLASAIAFVVAAATACRWADRRRIPAAESLLRWLCD